MPDLIEIRRKKEEIRKEILRILRGQTHKERKELSRKIQEELVSSPEYKKAMTIMVYVSLPTEVGTETIIGKGLETGKKVVVPFIEKGSNEITAAELKSITELVKGPFGIKQPKEDAVREVSLKEIELVVIPGIAFDRKNMRLGRGKGYYDRFLSKPDLSSARTIGLAFNCQIVDALPQDPHDIPVKKVISF